MYIIRGKPNPIPDQITYDSAQRPLAWAWACHETIHIHFDHMVKPMFSHTVVDDFPADWPPAKFLFKIMPWGFVNKPRPTIYNYTHTHVPVYHQCTLLYIRAVWCTLLSAQTYIILAQTGKHTLFLHRQESIHHSCTDRAVYIKLQLSLAHTTWFRRPRGFIQRYMTLPKRLLLVPLHMCVSTRVCAHVCDISRNVIGSSSKYKAIQTSIHWFSE